jgi:hypothetical protein
VVKGSTEGEDWVTVNHRSQSDDLNGTNETVTFGHFGRRQFGRSGWIRQKRTAQAGRPLRSPGCCWCRAAKTRVSSQIWRVNVLDRGWSPARHRLGSKEHSGPVRRLLFLLGGQADPVNLLRLRKAAVETGRFFLKKATTRGSG